MHCLFSACLIGKEFIGLTKCEPACASRYPRYQAFGASYEAPTLRWKTCGPITHITLDDWPCWLRVMGVCLQQYLENHSSFTLAFFLFHLDSHASVHKYFSLFLFHKRPFLLLNLQEFKNSLST